MSLTRKRLLFAYPEMMVGGSTTSLLSLLNTLDYDQYEVDLILYRNRGEFLSDIPAGVNLLPPAKRFADDDKSLRTKIIKFATASLKGYLTQALYSNWKYKRKIGLNRQVWAYYEAEFSRKLEKEYDVAIGYLELWPNAFILNNVKARKKIAWIHVDIADSPYIADIDCKQLSKADRIVSVSEKCLDSFKQEYHSLADKGVLVENILSAAYVRQKANELIGDLNHNYDGIRLLTVCRLSTYHKGLDRAIMAAKKLTDEGYMLRWFVVGEGSERGSLEKMIKDNQLEEVFILLGKRTNPYPYFKACDAYVMPSRYEGKPMAVTEAQILGLPVVVTRYASAPEQVRDNIDGIIVDNNDHDIYYGIKKILNRPELLDTFRRNLQTRQLSNESDIHQFYDILE